MQQQSGAAGGGAIEPVPRRRSNQVRAPAAAEVRLRRIHICSIGRKAAILERTLVRVGPRFHPAPSLKRARRSGNQQSAAREPAPDYRIMGGIFLVRCESPRFAMLATVPFRHWGHFHKAAMAERLFRPKA